MDHTWQAGLTRRFYTLCDPWFTCRWRRIFSKKARQHRIVISQGRASSR